MDPLSSGENSVASKADAVATSHCNRTFTLPPVPLPHSPPEPYDLPMFPPAHDAYRSQANQPPPVASHPCRPHPELESALLRLRRANLLVAQSVATLRLAQIEQRESLQLVASIGAATAAADGEEEAQTKKRAETTIAPTDGGDGGGNVTSTGIGGCGSSAFALAPYETQSINGAPNLCMSSSVETSPASDRTPCLDAVSKDGVEAVQISASQPGKEAEKVVARMRECHCIERRGGFDRFGTASESQSPISAGDQRIAPSQDDNSKCKKNTRKAPKKGKDRKPHKRKPIDMPRKALSAYNLFFAEERLRILKDPVGLGLGIGEEVDEDEDENQDIALCADMTRTIARSRLHNKSHGCVSFRDLAKTIAKRWKDLPPDRLERYNYLAEEDARRHREAMKAYYARKQRNMTESSAADLGEGKKG